MSLYSTLPDTFAGTLIAFPLFLATKARPIFAKLSSRKNQLGIPVSGQLPTYPSPNPTLTLTCYQLTVGNIGARKKILVRLSWPLWLMSGLYFEELPRKSKMIEQWLLYTNWGRTQIWGLPISMTASDALLRGHSVCWKEHFGFSIQVWGYYLY